MTNRLRTATPVVMICSQPLLAYLPSASLKTSLYSTIPTKS